MIWTPPSAPHRPVEADGSAVFVPVANTGPVEEAVPRLNVLIRRIEVPRRKRWGRQSRYGVVQRVIQRRLKRRVGRWWEVRELGQMRRFDVWSA